MLACSGASEAPGGNDNGPGTDVTVPASDCPDALAPQAISQPDAVVGAGTPQSCTSDSLRSAVAAGGSIVFDCGGAHTIVLDAPLSVTRATLVDGDGLLTLSGDDATRIFEVASGVSLTLQRINLENGLARTHGAGVFANGGGSLTVIDCAFRNNRAADPGRDIGGGAIYARGAAVRVSGATFTGNAGSNGGAIGNLRGNLSIVNSGFSANRATGAGGIAGQGGFGGAVYIDGMHPTAGSRSLTVCGSVFEGNQANADGGGLYSYFYPGEQSLIAQSTFRDNLINGNQGHGGGLYHQRQPLTLRESTFTRNRAAAVGGAIFIGPDSDAQITNVTIEGNRAPGLGGGIFSGDSPTRVHHATIAGNHAFFAGGISGAANVTLSDSIIAHNTHEEPFNGLNCRAPLTDGGGNVQYPEFRPNGTRDTPCAAGALIADPLLAPLADNGGPTQTMAPADASPALSLARNCAPIDQRGSSRSDPCDAGALER